MNLFDEGYTQLDTSVQSKSLIHNLQIYCSDDSRTRTDREQRGE